MTEAEDRIRVWREDPRIFVREVFNATPDPWQDEVLEAFAREQRIALKACKGPGKSTVEAWCGWNFLLTRPHPKVICTSITGDNLRDGLWAEYAKWQGRSVLLRETFEWTNTRIFAKDHPETWFASARQWSKSADPSSQADTLAGIHADHVLFQIDEAGGVPDAVASAAEAALATGVETKLMIAGNPTLLSGPLHRACTRERALWWVREITGDPDDPMRAPRIDIGWARAQIEKYGRDNAWVLVNVFGKFPPAQSNVLIGIEDVAEAVRRGLQPVAYTQDPVVLGVDVARYGDDRSVAVMRQGRRMGTPRTWRGLDLMTLSGYVADMMDEFQPAAVFIDQTGLGSGVVDRLRQLGRRVIGIDFGGKAREDRFVNRRAEMWWLMAEWVKTAAMPDIAELTAELTAPTYSYGNAAGRLQLESKEDLKKRGLPSPDLADALALTFAEPVAHPGLRMQRPITVHRAASA